MLSLSHFKLDHNFSRRNWWKIKRNFGRLTCVWSSQRNVHICIVENLSKLNVKKRVSMKSFIIIIGINRDFFFLLYIDWLFSWLWKKNTNDPINVNVQSVLYWNFIEFLVKKIFWCKKISEHQSICQIRFFPVIHFNYKCAFLSHVDFFSDFIYSHISRMRLKKFVKLHQQQPIKKMTFTGKSWATQNIIAFEWQT